MSAAIGISLPTPLSVSQEALQDAASAIVATVEGTAAIVVYCRKNRAGAMWLHGVWSSLSPVTVDEYLQALEAQRVAFAPGESLKRWVTHVTDRTGATN